MKERQAFSPWVLLRYVGLTLVALLLVAPFLWMISTSLKSPESVLKMPPEFFPNPPHFSNYGDVMESMRIDTYFFNSVKITVLGTIGELLAATFAAYAFARMQFRGKKIIYALLLATMLIPFQVTMVPVFMVIKTLGWMDSHSALIIPHFFGGAFATGAFGIFLLRQFFESIPQELEDVYQIDGGGSFRFLWKIVIPLSKPALAVLGLFIFMGIWNDLLSPVLFLSTDSKMTLPFWLATLQSASHVSRYDLLMAGTLISVAPVIILYLIVQRWVTDAFLRSGIKG